MAEKRIILASTSPRRRELLAKMGYEFTCDAPEVDENVEGRADEIVALLSARKAHAAAEKYSEGIIIASDTLVSLDGKGLGKPVDAQDAFRMLRELSGRTHEVFSGVCMIDTATGKEETQVARTGVIFRELTDEEINYYIATGETMDKAGAYGIQGGAGKFVTGLDGTFENVMGFPVDVVEDMLRCFL
ncbi:MAG: septum formation protein Maf [Clostridia bacterium]|nr:septum formation protein Maf [Clostridia bacterium]